MEENFSLTKEYGLTTVCSEKWKNADKGMDEGVLEEKEFLFHDPKMDPLQYLPEQDFFGGIRIDILLFPSDRYSVTPVEFSRDVEKAGCIFVGIKGFMMAYDAFGELFIPEFDVIIPHRKVETKHHAGILLYDGSVWKSADVAKDFLIGRTRRRGIIVGKRIK